jgi:hypothetical protein
LDKAEKLKASVRAKVEHPFRVIKRQFGFVKVRNKGLAKNAAQIANVCAVQFVDGTQAVDGSAGMSATEMGQKSPIGAQKAQQNPKNGAQMPRLGH